MISDIVLHVAVALYFMAALLLAVFVSSFGVLLVIYWMTRRAAPALPVVKDADLPSVTVHLPVYNEMHVIERLIDACARLDYPPGKLSVQIIDDSTDETTRLIRRRIAYWRDQGMGHLDLLRRPVRSGYKAGALAYGLDHTQAEFIAVFDADFIPPRDFLRRTVPYFIANPDRALVQTRWDHLNRTYNGLTRAQALTMDGHFIVEQTARNRGRLPMSMNGTGGLWRVSALRDAGGWSADTLTEDLDLSYRALLRGWKFLYLPDVTVPGELPPQVQAYKMQQRRWATGMTENLVKHAIPLLRSHRSSSGQKLMGLAHLAQYAVQPLILLVFLLTPVLLWGDMFRHLPNLVSLFGAAGLIAPAIMVTAQWELGGNWTRRLLAFPVQFIIGAAAVLNNTLGVLDGLHPRGVTREFKRTPKFRLTQPSQRWSHSRYALRIDGVTWGEIALGVYATVGAALALDRLPALVPYMGSYAAAFFIFACWNIYQSVGVSRPQRSLGRESSEIIRRA